MAKEIIAIDPERCTGCGLCKEVCVRGIIELKEETARVKDAKLCILCGHCRAVCPVDAPVLCDLDPDEFEAVPPRAEYPDAAKLLRFFRARRSTRLFTREPVDIPDLERIIQAGRFAPTGGNRQPVRYVVLRTPEAVDEARQTTFRFLAEQARAFQRAMERHLRHGGPRPPRAEIMKGYAPLWLGMGDAHARGKDTLFYHAPAVMVLHLDPERSSPFASDAGLAAMQMVLMAEALSLGSCFCGFFTYALNNSPEVKERFTIPAHHAVPLTFVLGHPDVAFRSLVSRNTAKVSIL